MPHPVELIGKAKFDSTISSDSELLNQSLPKLAEMIALGIAMVCMHAKVYVIRLEGCFRYIHNFAPSLSLTVV